VPEAPELSSAVPRLGGPLPTLATVAEDAARWQVAKSVQMPIGPDYKGHRACRVARSVTIGLVEGKSGLSKYSTPFGRRAIKEYTSDPK